MNRSIKSIEINWKEYKDVTKELIKIKEDFGLKYITMRRSSKD